MDHFESHSKLQIELKRMDAIKEFIILRATNPAVHLTAQQMTEQYDKLTHSSKEEISNVRV